MSHWEPFLFKPPHCVTGTRFKFHGTFSYFLKIKIKSIWRINRIKLGPARTTERSEKDKYSILVPDEEQERGLFRCLFSCLNAGFLEISLLWERLVVSKWMRTPILLLEEFPWPRLWKCSLSEGHCPLGWFLAFPVLQLHRTLGFLLSPCLSKIGLPGVILI